MLDAFKKFNTKSRPKPYRPAVTINVCGKRHHARFPGTSQDHMIENGNTVPGTVVDKGVTDIYNFDYYLQVCVLASFKGPERSDSAVITGA